MIFQSLIHLSANPTETLQYLVALLTSLKGMCGPSEALLNLSSALLFISLMQVAGPWFMRDRKPYNLKGVLLVYNLGQTLFRYLYWITTVTDQ